MNENFPKLMTDAKLHIWETQRILSIINKNKEKGGGDGEGGRGGGSRGGEKEEEVEGEEEEGKEMRREEKEGRGEPYMQHIIFKLQKIKGKEKKILKEGVWSTPYLKRNKDRNCI